MLFLNVKNITNILFDLSILESLKLAHDTNVLSYAGIFCVTTTFLVFGFILLSNIHVGFLFFAKAFITSVSVAQILLALSLFIAGVVYGSVIPAFIFALFLAACAVIGLTFAFKGNRDKVKCLEISYVVLTVLIALLLLAVLVVLIILHTALPSMLRTLCSDSGSGSGSDDDDDAEGGGGTEHSSAAAAAAVESFLSCGTVEAVIQSLACSSLAGEDLEICRRALSGETLIGIVSAIAASLLNIVMWPVIHLFLLFILLTILTCITGYMAKRRAKGKTDLPYVPLGTPVEGIQA